MKLWKLLACVCCAGMIFITGCEGSPKQTERAANTLGASSISGTAAETFISPSDAANPTASVTIQTPTDTFSYDMSASTHKPTLQLPVPVGAEYLRPSDEEIALFKEDYADHVKALPERTGDRVISYENTCVIYEYAYNFLSNYHYNWDNGMPNVRDITEKEGYKMYYIPVYTRADNGVYELTEYIYYSDYGRGIENWYISRREDIYKYWYEYPVELTFHTMASYVYEDVERAQSGKITGMALLGDICNGWVYCVIDTDHGSYMYAFPYDESHSVSMDCARAYRGKLYTDVNEFKELYFYRVENTSIEGSGAALNPDVPICIYQMKYMDMAEEKAFRKAFTDYRMAMSAERRRDFDIAWRGKKSNYGCVIYDFRQYALQNHDWNKGMPTVKELCSLEKGKYNKTYFTPVYWLNNNSEYILTDVVTYNVYSDNTTKLEINTAKEMYESNWLMPSIMPVHIMANYMYTAVENADLGRVSKMVLFADVNYSYLYGIIDTEKGSYIYDFPYVEGINVNTTIVKEGTLYTDAEEFRRLYLERMVN